MTEHKEKKSETLEVRIPHSKKKAFQKACAEEGITASHAVRTFIDSYLKRSRRVKLKRITREISMTLIRNPIKSTGGIGALVTASVATFGIFAAPSVADDRNFQPINAPSVAYPVDLAKAGIGADCTASFNVRPNGTVDAESLSVDCTHPGFVEATEAAIITLRFEPKLKDGEPVWRKGVIYPIQYLIESSPDKS